MEFVLIRHTAVACAAGTCYGRLDLPLAASAANDVAAAVGRAPRVDEVFTSPARRCMQLASALAQRDRCPLDISEALQELHFGAWEGRSWSEISRAESEPWTQDPWERAPPDGETERALWQRVEHWYEACVRTRTQGRTAVVAHAGPLRILRCLLLGLPASTRWAWHIEPGEVVCVRSTGAARY